VALNLHAQERLVPPGRALDAGEANPVREGRMGYRNFLDTNGIEWQAWDIVPQLAERRATERRAARLAVTTERRRANERRHEGGGRPVLSRGFSAGWLCFDALLEKRRLAPAPADWLVCCLARLEEYLRAAVPAPRGLTECTSIGHLDRRAG
jgi:hypothetical protein